MHAVAAPSPQAKLISWRVLFLVPLAALMGLMLLLSIAKPVYAICDSTITVTSNADSGSGTLREAISNICDYGTISFDAALNNSTITLTAELEITQNLTITGPGAELLSISGDDLGRVFNINSYTIHVTLHGLTIRDAATFMPGAGIRNTGVLTLTQMVIRDNTTTNSGQGGAGIFNQQGKVTLIDSVIRDNQTNATASVGAGISNDFGTVVVISSTIHNNQTTQPASEGAGIFNRGTLTLTNSFVTSNTTAGTDSHGGGIWTNERALIVGTVISGNTTLAANVDGAGIYIATFATYTLITDTVIQDNHATGKGGGIHKASNTTVNLTNSTVADNSTSVSDGTGGGIYNDTGAFTIVNSQITDNQTSGSNAHGGGLYNVAMGTLDISRSTIRGNYIDGDSSGANGAGIYSAGTLTLTESIVEGNQTNSGSSRSGGGIYATGATAIDKSFIGENFAGTSGGGLYKTSDATLTMVNTTVYSNSTGLVDGGGLALYGNGSTTRLLHNTFAYNQAGNNTGNAVWNQFTAAISATNNLFIPPGLTNTFTATVPAQCVGFPTSTGTPINVGLESSCFSTGMAVPLVFAVGEVGTYGGNVPVLPLLPLNIAIDTVQPNTCADTDARGVARPQGAQCDFGAFESRGFSLTVASGNNQSTLVNTPFAHPFAINVTNAYSEPVDGGHIIFSPPEDGASVGLASMIPVASIDNGTATITGTANMIGGHYSMLAVASVYNPSGILTFTLTNIAPTEIAVTSEANPSEYADGFTLTTTVSPSVATGEIIWRLNGHAFSPETLGENGTLTKTITYLPPGVYTFTATYSGTASYLGSTSTVYTQTVNNISTFVSLTSDPNPSEVDENVLFTATVEPDVIFAPSGEIGGGFGIAGAAPFTGSVEFYNGASLLDTQEIDESGVATYTTSSLEPGAHPITAVYVGHSVYLSGTSAIYTQTVNKIGTSIMLTSDINPREVDYSVLFTATIAPDSGITSLGEIGIQGGNPYEGVVEFYNGDTFIISQTVDFDGVAAVSIDDLPVGENAITAHYLGNATYLTSTSSVYTQTITQHATETALEIAPNPVTFGGWVIFTSTVSTNYNDSGFSGQIQDNPLEGYVQLYVGNTVNVYPQLVDANGVATYTTYALAQAGLYTFTSVYSGNDKYAGSTSNSVPLLVNRAASTTTVESAPNPAYYGEGVTFTATVSHDVMFQIGSLGLGNEVNAQITNYLAGNVIFKEGANIIGEGEVDVNGIATYTSYSLEVGTYSVTAEYVGNQYFAGSTSDNLSQVVNQAPTETDLQVAPNPITVGDWVGFTATVSSDYILNGIGVQGQSYPLAGEVVFYVNGNPDDGEPTDENGVATDAGYAFTPAGNYTISAGFGGNTNFAPSTSNEVILTVNHAPSTVAVVSSRNPSTVGDAVTFTATVGSNLIIDSVGALNTGLNAQRASFYSGNVTFKAGANTLGTTEVDPDGVATFTTNALAAGSHAITVVYAGNEYLASSTSGTLTQIVNAQDVPPFAVNDAAGTLENVAVSIAVLSNDVNHSNGALAIQSITQPNHGSATINGSNIVYTPASDFSGLDTLTYTVVDGNSLTNVGTVAVVVSAQSASGQAPQVAIIDNGSAGEATFTGEDADIELTVPSGIYTGTLTEKDVFYLVLTWLINPSEGNSGNLQFANLTFDLSAYLNGNKLEHFVFGSPVTMKISYADTLLGDLSPESVQLLYLNESTWDNSGIELVGHDVESRIFEVRISHLSEFALFAQSPTNLPDGEQPKAQMQLFMPRLGQ